MIWAVIAAVASLAGAIIKSNSDSTIAGINQQITDEQGKTAIEVANIQEEIELIRFREAKLVKEATDLKTKSNIQISVILVSGFLVAVFAWFYQKTTEDK